MNCTRIRSRLDLYAGDDLAGRDAAEVEAHLRACLACYREYAELRDLLLRVRGAQRPESVEKARTALAGDADGPLGGSFVEGVMRQIQGPPPAAPRILERLTLVSGWAAAIVLGVSLGWGALMRGGAADGAKDDLNSSTGVSSDGLRPSLHPRVVDAYGDSALRSIDHAGRDQGLDLETQFVNDLERLRSAGPAKSPPGSLMPPPVEVGPRRIRDF